MRNVKVHKLRSLFSRYKYVSEEYHDEDSSQSGIKLMKTTGWNIVRLVRPMYLKDKSLYPAIITYRKLK
ncbi:MAG: hypothetical protein DRP09_10560 [Candidatus Thorarchaeota archaeon]|nr:MAG: hypothetical protein DRP09_10560 [Candidatus Thorarchaeota archaeon]